MATAFTHDEPEICASYRRAGEAIDCYRLWVDGLILHIEARGYWDMAVAEAYSRDVKRIVAERRRLHPHLRAIADRSTVPDFAPGVPERLLATYGDILRTGDRVALLVDSSLTKGQVRKIAGREETETFLSLSAARTWVLAYG